MTTSDHEARGPSPVASEVSAPAGPISFVRRREIEELHRELEISDTDGMASMESITKYRNAIFAQYFRERPEFALAWPDSLYIPSDADFKNYWIASPPASHRYRYHWVNTVNGQSAGSSASEATGHLFSWINVSALKPSYIGFAGVGVSVVPQATLSYVKVSADIDAVTESRWWFMPGTAAGFANFSYRGTAYVAGWEVDPVTGQWELLKPFGSRTLFKSDESGQGGSAINSQVHAFNDLTVTLQLQGGHSYAIGVAFETEITFDCRDRDGHPYKRQPGDDIKLWASIAGSVPSITVST